MTTETQQLYEMVSELMDKLEEMSDWENDFVLDIAEYQEDGKLFSTAQAEKINEIHRRYCN